MKRGSGGFSLLEMMVALALGLVVVLGITRIFIAAKDTYLAQTASAQLQEDARFALSKMIQEIRMVGMFGCLATDAMTYADASIAREFANPITFVRNADGSAQTLTLISAGTGLAGGRPTWTIVTDCRTSAHAYRDAKAAGSGQFALPVHKLVYSVENHQLKLQAGGSPAVMTDNVAALKISFGVANQPSDTAVARYSDSPSDPATIRSVRLSLTLSDPAGRVRDQTYNVVASLRNRLE
ncbi:PilW family protein [Pseudomonas akapageensis]|uniref:PilW family protein n=1 Tax=Pseudomonas akapageensis TaxID=2609961 RepID=UPI00140C2456|nr:prepilin-type N-terminal cleavage/methylation domain-containing protein [Pseudomonas akapageensis]